MLVTELEPESSALDQLGHRRMHARCARLAKDTLKLIVGTEGVWRVGFEPTPFRIGTLLQRLGPTRPSPRAFEAACRGIGAPDCGGPLRQRNE